MQQRRCPRQFESDLGDRALTGSLDLYVGITQALESCFILGESSPKGHKIQMSEILCQMTQMYVHNGS